MNIRFIGDVHGLYKKYVILTQKADFSIALGDIGFDYSFLGGVDHTKHKLLAGNHDNYDIMQNYPHFLGDFGMHAIDGECQIPFDCFYVRGGFSIDKQYRIPHRTWWPNEELSYAQMQECAALYEKIKPSIVISHECPADITPFVVKNDLKIQPSNTSKLLNHLLTIHQPDIWVFGHLHVSFRGVVEKVFPNTMFYGLGELEYVDFEV